MHREQLKTLLNRYQPSREEIDCKERMLRFLAQHGDCFERSLESGHFTASAWLLNRDCTKILLMHHAKLDRWVQLGGHCDGNPDVLQVAIKEAQEESGILQISPVSKEIFDVDIHLIPARGSIAAHQHFDVRFLLQAASSEAVRNHESKELRWIGKNPEEMPTANPSVLRMFDKWRASLSC